MSKQISNQVLQEMLAQIQSEQAEQGLALDRIEDEIKATNSHLQALSEADSNRNTDWTALKSRIERIKQDLKVNG